MICQDIMNIIKNYVIMERNKDKFNEVVKQINRIQHDYDEGGDAIHTITIRKKNYDLEFSFMEHYTSKKIELNWYDRTQYFRLNGSRIEGDIPFYEWDSTENIHWNFDDSYTVFETDINRLKEMEKFFINHCNINGPMKRTIKIKK